MSDPALQPFLQTGVIKLCPGCNAPTEKVDGCNYLKCICNCEWCWVCNLVKFKVCNDPTHNSHS